MVMSEISKKRSKNYYCFWGLFIILIIAGIIAVVLNRRVIYDWYKGVTYNPSTEMLSIRDKLNLTSDGEFLFNAVQPRLDEAKDFNQNCRQDESEMAVLGCYTMGDIHVYNIVAEELDGIRELTTAHELLHAKWDRMSEDERKELSASLTQVFDSNRELLESEIELYGTNEKQEELYVRVGTEVKDLPDDLEKHFAEIFRDQDAVVDFYDGYIAVFNEIKSNMETLLVDIEALKGEISVRTTEYESQAEQLEAEIVSFNSCAEVSGCFETKTEFDNRRNQILGKQDNLKLLNSEIDDLIKEYNKKVDEYNANVIESRKLQDMVNSNSEVDGI